MVGRTTQGEGTLNSRVWSNMLACTSVYPNASNRELDEFNPQVCWTQPQWHCLGASQARLIRLLR